MQNINRIAPKKNGLTQKKRKKSGGKKEAIEANKLMSDISKLQEANSKISQQHTAKVSELKDLQKLYSRLQKEQKKNDPSKRISELQRQNEKLKGELNEKNEKISSLEQTINSLNCEISKKNEQISVIEAKKEKQISEIQQELSAMTSKYEALYIEHSKQHKLLRQLQSSNKSPPEKLKNIVVNDKTKDSAAEPNGNYFDDTKDEIYESPKPNKRHSVTPITPLSETASIQSVNSADSGSEFDDEDVVASDGDKRRTIVIDNGSETLKIGYASESQNSHRPTKKFHSIIGRPRNQSNLSKQDLFIGDDAYSKNSILAISNVIKRGKVTDWDMMEKLWEHTFYRKLNISPNDAALSNYDLLLTESLNRSNEEREKSVQIMFESFDINSLYMQNEAVLSLFGAGKINGAVLGIGYGVTYSTAIYEGQCIPSSVIRVNSAGYDISAYLKQLLAEKYCTVLKSTKHSVIKDIKQKHCYVADNFYHALKQNANSYKKYKLPDGQNLRIGTERFRASEQLFGGFINLNNEEMSRDTKKLFNKGAAFNNSGIQHMVNESIRLVQDDELKRECYSNIVLSGGSTLFKGLDKRLKSEVCKLIAAENPHQSVTIIANEKRKYLAWIGGSILSSLQNYKQNFIQKSQYDEEGASCVHRQCPK